MANTPNDSESQNNLKAEPQTQPETSATPVVSKSKRASLGATLRDRKKLPFVIGAVIGIVLLIGAIAAIVLALTAVSDNDYREAQRSVQSVSPKLRAVQSDASRLASLGASSLRESRVEEDISNLKDSVNELEAENKKLSELKAITNDSEARELYDDFKSESDELVKFARSLTGSESAFVALAECEDISPSTSGTGVEAAERAFADCERALDNSTAKNENIEEFVSAYKEFISSLRDSISDVSASERLQISRSISAAQRELNNTAREIRTELRDEVTNDEATDSIRDLRNYLLEKTAA